MRADPRLRHAVHGMAAALVATGLGWWLLGRCASTENPFGPPEPHPAMPWLLAAHGTLAMLALLLGGVVMVRHIGPAWATGRRRPTGLALAGCTLALLATAPLLYYAGAEPLRAAASTLHLVMGVAFPALLLAHRHWATRR